MQSWVFFRKKTLFQNIFKTSFFTGGFYFTISFCDKILSCSYHLISPSENLSALILLLKITLQ